MLHSVHDYTVPPPIFQMMKQENFLILYLVTYGDIHQDSIKHPICTLTLSESLNRELYVQ